MLTMSSSLESFELDYNLYLYCIFSTCVLVLSETITTGNGLVLLHALFVFVMQGCVVTTVPVLPGAGRRHPKQGWKERQS